MWVLVFWGAVDFPWISCLLAWMSSVWSAVDLLWISGFVAWIPRGFSRFGVPWICCGLFVWVAWISSGFFEGRMCRKIQSVRPSKNPLEIHWKSTPAGGKSTRPQNTKIHGESTRVSRNPQEIHGTPNEVPNHPPTMHRSHTNPPSPPARRPKMHPGPLDLSILVGPELHGQSGLGLG